MTDTEYRFYLFDAEGHISRVEISKWDPTKFPIKCRALLRANPTISAVEVWDKADRLCLCRSDGTSTNSLDCCSATPETPGA